VIGSFLILKITDIISPMTISQAEKNIGSDLSQHGEQIQTFGMETVEEAM
jgi:Amt family ammonium transporter